MVPSLTTTVYPVIADPPLFAGAVKESTTLALPEAAVTLVGAFGTVEGVADEEAMESGEVPIPFVAVTWNVYAIPFVNPFTTQL